MTARETEIIELIKKEVKPALGCTEPIAVALAVAKAMEIIEEKCNFTEPDWRMNAGYRLKIEVSGNILKNGMGVGIPGTGMVGLHIAGALGAVCGKSCYGLEVLHDLDETTIQKAKEMVENDLVMIGLADTDHKLYVKATVESECEHCASAVIEDDHDRIVETCFDHNVLNTLRGDNKREEVETKTTLDYSLTVKEILEFASTVGYEDIAFILDSRTLNLALAEEGMKGSYGLKVGYSINHNSNKEVFGEDFLSYSSDSHVAVITGEDFSMQMEYAPFFKDEDFATLAAAAEKKYKDFARVSFNGVEGVRYREGDGVCFCLTVDEYSYLLLTLIKAQGCDKTLEELAAGEDFAELLGTLRIRTKE